MGFFLGLIFIAFFVAPIIFLNTLLDHAHENENKRQRERRNR